MSDTPRTDGNAEVNYSVLTQYDFRDFVDGDFARELERENAGLKEIAAHAEEQRIVLVGKVAKLEDENARLEKINHTASLDWVHDHTHLQNLCRAAGWPEFEVEGDRYGVPGIIELADLLAKQNAKLRAACHIFLDARKHDGYGMEDAERAIRAALAKEDGL